MRRPIPIYLALCALVPVFLCTGAAFGQCQYDVEYTVEQKSPTSYSILLKSETRLASLKIQLYDLLKGEVMEEKEVTSLSSAQEIFQNVGPSKYAIIIRTANCDKPKSLGGMHGISIGTQDQ